MNRKKTANQQPPTAAEDHYISFGNKVPSQLRIPYERLCAECFPNGHVPPPSSKGYTDNCNLLLQAVDADSYNNGTRTEVWHLGRDKSPNCKDNTTAKEAARAVKRKKSRKGLSGPQNHIQKTDMKRHPTIAEAFIYEYIITQQWMEWMGEYDLAVEEPLMMNLEEIKEHFEIVHGKTSILQRPINEQDLHNTQHRAILYPATVIPGFAGPLMVALCVEADTEDNGFTEVWEFTQVGEHYTKFNQDKYRRVGFSRQ
jgi:hypothetical protein